MVQLILPLAAFQPPYSDKHLIQDLVSLNTGYSRLLAIKGRVYTSHSLSCLCSIRSNLLVDKMFLELHSRVAFEGIFGEWVILVYIFTYILKIPTQSQLKVHMFFMMCQMCMTLTFHFLGFGHHEVEVPKKNNWTNFTCNLEQNSSYARLICQKVSPIAEWISSS